jgi:hypothetical protein
MNFIFKYSFITILVIVLAKYILIPWAGTGIEWFNSLSKFTQLILGLSGILYLFLGIISDFWITLPPPESKGTYRGQIWVGDGYEYPETLRKNRNLDLRIVAITFIVDAFCVVVFH